LTSDGVLATGIILSLKFDFWRRSLVLEYFFTEFEFAIVVDDALLFRA